MNERVKIFTHITSTTSSAAATSLEEHVNDWLRTTNGRMLNVSQSESERKGIGHHVTICVWYEPADTSSAP